MFVQALAGSSFGLMFGCLNYDMISALNLNQMSFMMLNFGSGLITSNHTKNPVLKVLQVISPFRYA